jgi:transcriptional/translational regulatory protein YebC/TACO1
MFDRVGLITLDRSKTKEDDVLSAALDAGAEDVRTVGEVIEVVTSPEQFFKVKQALERAKLPILSADVTLIPKTTVRVEGKDAQHVLQLMDALEDHDDVQQVYANFDIPDEILQQVG